jgi:hypothetical protein
MAPAPKPRSRKSVGRKSGGKASSTAGSNKIRGRPGPFDDVWQSFIDSVQMELQRSINLPVEERRSKYHHSVAVVKRMAYAFVLQHRSRTKESVIEGSIERFRQEREKKKKLDLRKNLRKITKKYKHEPFYWVLEGMKDAIGIAEFRIRDYDVSRFSVELTYADRHDVPEHYLIGFLLQTGRLQEIIRRAKDVNRREEWYLNSVPTTSAR